jgi:large subunit ribosomal protein L24e
VIGVKCTFCGGDIPKGKGKMFVRNSGQILYFCGSKCQKNHAIKRDGKSVRWTKRFEELKKK